MKNLLRKILCFLGEHKWTCDAEKGIEPIKGQDFRDYATMYCDYCKKISRLSL